MPSRIAYDRERVVAFCERWGVVRMWLFGSVLRDDFQDGSDVDVMIDLAADSPTDYMDWHAMLAELRAIFVREVDLVPYGPIKNPFRRRAIMKSLESIYER